MPYVFEPEMSETTNTRPPSDFSPRVTAPLGYIVHAHSDDKRTDCNVGFYARNADGYLWLQSLLSAGRATELFQNDYNGKRIEQFKSPKIHGRQPYVPETVAE